MSRVAALPRCHEASMSDVGALGRAAIFVSADLAMIFYFQ